MRTSYVLTVLVLVGTVTYQQFGGPRDGVGNKWYDEQQQFDQTPNIASTITLLIEPEENGHAQDVKGTYTLVKGVDGIWRCNSGNLSLTITKMETYFLMININGVMWHGNHVLYYKNSARQVYWRLGGPSGCVKVTVSY